MAAYSVADAKNALPKLIDSALQGEEVVITRHGKPVAEVRPISAQPADASATYAWLKKRRLTRRSTGLTSVQILDHLYEEAER